MTSPIDPISAALEARARQHLINWGASTGNGHIDTLVAFAKAELARALPVSAGEPVAWRCFHCGMVCKTEEHAREHFGPTMDYAAACQGNGGQAGQMLRVHVKSLLNGMDTGLVRIESDADETLARDLAGIRYAVDAFTADLLTAAPQPVACQDGWKPIETFVPDDREECIQICNARSGLNQQRVAYFDASNAEYPWHVEDAAKGFNHAKGWPTHWKRLDAPPKLSFEKHADAKSGVTK